MRSLSGDTADRARLDGVAQVLADKKFHHHERLAVLFAEIEDLDDVLVLDVAGHARFLQKARFRFRIGAALLRENLQGDRSPDDRVTRAVDMGHAAAQELL